MKRYRVDPDLTTSDRTGFHNPVREIKTGAHIP